MEKGSRSWSCFRKAVSQKAERMKLFSTFQAAESSADWGEKVCWQNEYCGAVQYCSKDS